MPPTTSASPENRPNSGMVWGRPGIISGPFGHGFRGLSNNKKNQKLNVAFILTYVTKRKYIKYASNINQNPYLGGPRGSSGAYT